ncbi:unnamed protein product [Brassica rapa subsp. trilocularis]|uniref:Uncharacterized protein n=1 Tax=Brassica campestris TaxID=3711 RepID=A0A3P6A031_BRACM|nr:unnamed protein product [Brassica rapa]
MEGVVSWLKDNISRLKQSMDLLLKMNRVDHISHQT